MRGRVIACGGLSGRYDSAVSGLPEYDRIESYIFRDVGCKKVLYVPTAGADNQERVSEKIAGYRNKFGFSAGVLWLVRSSQRADYVEKINSADIIFVDGGNTVFLLRVWRKFGVDSLLERARERGALIAGVSAGANCWHESGNSNAAKSRKTAAPLLRVPCLNWIPLLFCPHYGNEDDRRPGLKKMLKEYNGTGLGVADDTAVEYAGNSWRLIFNGDRGRAWKCCWKRDRYSEEPLPDDGRLRDIACLTDAGRGWE